MFLKQDHDLPLIINQAARDGDGRVWNSLHRYGFRIYAAGGSYSWLICPVCCAS